MHFCDEIVQRRCRVGDVAVRGWDRLMVAVLQWLRLDAAERAKFDTVAEHRNRSIRGQQSSFNIATMNPFNCFQVWCAYAVRCSPAAVCAGLVSKLDVRGAIQHRTRVVPALAVAERGMVVSYKDCMLTVNCSGLGI